MYEKLTALIPVLQRETFKEHQTLVEEYCNEGGSFGGAAHRLQAELSNFMEEHPEFGLTQYHAILKENGLWNRDALENADVEALDGKVLMALLVSAWRVDRRCMGTTFVALYESGHILKWLERLKALDEA